MCAPGSSAHLRRLGDLRLQCRASFFSGVARSGIIARTFLSSVLKPWSTAATANSMPWSSFADAPVFGIRLVHGDRALHLNQSMVGGLRDPAGSSFDWGYALRHQLFRLPMGDERWPDDARVEFEWSPTRKALSTMRCCKPQAHCRGGSQPATRHCMGRAQTKAGRDAGMVRYDHSGLRVVRYLQEQLPSSKQGLGTGAAVDGTKDRLVKFALRAMGEQRLAQAVPDRGRQAERHLDGPRTHHDAHDRASTTGDLAALGHPACGVESRPDAACTRHAPGMDTQHRWTAWWGGANEQNGFQATGL